MRKLSQLRLRRKRQKEIDILDVEGLGGKGIQEIKKVLANYGITLK